MGGAGLRRCPPNCRSSLGEWVAPTLDRLTRCGWCRAASDGPAAACGAAGGLLAAGWLSPLAACPLASRTGPRDTVPVPARTPATTASAATTPTLAQITILAIGWLARARIGTPSGFPSNCGDHGRGFRPGFSPLPFLLSRLRKPAGVVQARPPGRRVVQVMCGKPAPADPWLVTIRSAWFARRPAIATYAD